MRRLMRVVTPVIALLFGATPAAADHVLILRSGDEKPYVQAQQGATDALQKAGHTVTDAVAPRATWTGVDVVLTIGSKAAYWAKDQAPASVLLAYCMIPDAGSLNLTQHRPAVGVTTSIPIAEQVHLIRQTLPKANQIALLYRHNNESHRQIIGELRAALPPGASIHAVAMENHASESSAIADLMKPEVDVIWTMPDATIYKASTVRALLLGALRNRKPVYGFSPAFVRAGALVGTGIDPTTQGKQSVQIIQQALRDIRDGNPPSLSVMPAQAEYQIALNLHVARELRTTIPKSLEQRASYVFGEEGK